MTTTWIKAAYGVVLGVLLMVTVVFGLAVFNNGPTPPKPLGLTFSQFSQNTSDAEANRITKQIDGFYQDAQNYQASYPDYQRDIFLWYTGLGIALAVLGVALPAVVNYLRFGFVVGGVLLIGVGAWTALQPVPSPIHQDVSGISALLAAGTPKVIDTGARFIRFAIAIVGLLILLFVGLWRLTDWTTVPVRVVVNQPAPVVPPAPVAAPAPASTPASSAAAERWARPEERVDAVTARSEPAVEVAAQPPPGAEVWESGPPPASPASGPSGDVAPLG
jgi:hypothetical protein